MTRAEWIESLDRCGADAARYRFLKKYPNEGFRILREVYMMDLPHELDQLVDDARNKS